MRRARYTQAQGFRQQARLPSLQEKQGLSRLSTADSGERDMAVERHVFGHLDCSAFGRKAGAVEQLSGVYRSAIRVKGFLPSLLREIKVGQPLIGSTIFKW